MDIISIEQFTEDRLEEAISVAAQAFSSETAKQNAEIDFPATFMNLPRPYSTLVAIYEGKVIGAIQCTHGYLSVDIYNITWVCVAPEYQRKGYGRQILDKGCEFIENKFLKGKKGTIALVSDINPSYYEASGFEVNPTTHAGGTIMRKIVGEN